MPRPSDGNARADGYTSPSVLRISGPTAPGQREAATANVSIVPVDHTMSGLAISTSSVSVARTPRLAAAPYPRLPPISMSDTLSYLVAASCGMPSVEALSASNTGTGCRLAPSRVERNVASDSPGEYVTTTTEMFTGGPPPRRGTPAHAVGRSGPR